MTTGNFASRHNSLHNLFLASQSSSFNFTWHTWTTTGLWWQIWQKSYVLRLRVRPACYVTCLLKLSTQLSGAHNIRNFVRQKFSIASDHRKFQLCSPEGLGTQHQKFWMSNILNCWWPEQFSNVESPIGRGEGCCILPLRLWPGKGEISNEAWDMATLNVWLELTKSFNSTSKSEAKAPE